MNAQLAEFFTRLAELENKTDGAVILLVTKGPESGLKASTITFTGSQIDALGMALACVEGMTKKAQR